MNRRELWCERTAIVRTKNLGAHDKVFLSGESAGDPGYTEILASELRVAQLRAITGMRTALPHKAVTSGDSQNQPNSPPTLCAMTSRCSTTPASRGCSLQFQVFDRSRTSRRSESECRFRRAYKSQVPFLRWALTLVCGICSAASGSTCTARSARLKIRQPWKRTCCGET